MVVDTPEMMTQGRTRLPTRMPRMLPRMVTNTRYAVCWQRSLPWSSRGSSACQSACVPLRWYCGQADKRSDQEEDGRKLLPSFRFALRHTIFSGRTGSCRSIPVLQVVSDPASHRRVPSRRRPSSHQLPAFRLRVFPAVRKIVFCIGDLILRIGDLRFCVGNLVRWRRHSDSEASSFA